MQTKRIGLIMCGLLLAGITSMASGQEITLQNFNSTSSPEPVVKIKEEGVTVPEHQKVVDPNVMHAKKHKAKFPKVTTVPATLLIHKTDYAVAAPKLKKSLAALPEKKQPATDQPKQSIVPVEKAIWSETKETVPSPTVENTPSSVAIRLGFAVLFAFLSTGSVLGFVFVRSKNAKTPQVYYNAPLSIQPKETEGPLHKKAMRQIESKHREYAHAMELDLEAAESQEQMIRNDYELSNALQELKSKQRINSVVTAKKNMKSPKQIIGTAKKIGTGIGELELATRLAKMQIRSTSKVVS